MAIVDAEGTSICSASVTGEPTLYYNSPVGTALAISSAHGDIVELVAPKLTSAVTTGYNVVRATFSEPMKNNAALAATGNYSITPLTPIDTVGVAILFVNPEAVPNPTYVDLQVTDMTDGKTYNLFVENVEDPSGNVIDPVYDNVNFSGTGHLPHLDSITPITSTKLRFQFSEAMKKDSALASISNYALMPITPGAAPLYFTVIEVPDVPLPTYVDVTVSEMTNGASYQGGVFTPSMTDVAWNPVDPSFDTITFTGLGDPPTIKEVRAISTNRVDVVFSEMMQNNSDIIDPAKYTFDNGLLTLGVLEMVGDTAKLVTSDQASGILYTLSVTP